MQKPWKMPIRDEFWRYFFKEILHGLRVAQAAVTPNPNSTQPIIELECGSANPVCHPYHLYLVETLNY